MNIQRVRLLLSFVGVLFIGLAIGLSRAANLGTDPFTTFNVGLSHFFGIQFGTYMILTNIVGLILMFYTARNLIYIGTFMSIILVGYISDFVVSILFHQFGNLESLLIRGVLGALGIVLLAFGASLYIVAAQGIAPYDALPVIVESRSKGRISFQTARIVSDIVCITVGFLFGATVGVITVISGFFMGPLMQFFRTRFTNTLQSYVKK
ncbi:YczE/YyaS/YitT family protein [Jeotgalibaca caeni]|uniref:YczE/YyaS/YitT family protein n=1 Tax=Jeotgalibaca caeni TaxID=3028623 RepID=UPI00237ECBB1|nr:hypothetical protein [Jeotgalibaca caeni]MDE1549175.1 hypothetical protein [Jeotgalibaca caeni]